VKPFHPDLLGIDLALGVGYPRGKLLKYWSRIFWKNNLTLHAIAEAQKQWNCYFNDAEHAQKLREN
jgi:hypothetical protein